ncbi:hypothetical protein ACFS07_29680 [Undibacterium arcticum]
MLTATYALVAIAVEHKKTWATSSTLQQYLQSSSKARQAIDPLGLESVVNQLVQIDDSCHQRKVEVYVIPAIRKATREADSLLAELESLSTLGGEYSQVRCGAIAAGLRPRDGSNKRVVLLHGTLLPESAAKTGERRRGAIPDRATRNTERRVVCHMRPISVA